MGDENNRYENNGCVKKSKLTITVNILSKYNQRSRVAAKQANKQTYSETQNLRNIQVEKILQEEKYIQIDAQADLLWTHAHRELNKKWKMRRLMFCCY